MLDETIAPILYRTGRGDRSIPFLLGLLLVGSAPVFLWLSGPYWWPWGGFMAAVALLGGVGALRRWRTAGQTVLWDEGAGAIEFQSGGRKVLVPWSTLTKVEVRPSSVRTHLWVGRKRLSFSHRLVRTESLLEKLQARRPDLFPGPQDIVKLHRSAASALLQAALALGTGGAGWILWSWNPWVGVFFAASAFYILVRILFFIPLSYEISSGTVLTRYWLRVRRWGRPNGVREVGYAAGGAVFLRMILDYGSWKVVLDEGQLVDHLRSQAGWIVHLLRPSATG